MTTLDRLLMNTLGVRVPRFAAPFLPDLLWRSSDATPALYFTFDDGPDPADHRAGGTLGLLELLAKFEVPAVFFQIGKHAIRWPHLVKEIVAAGHQVGNHSFTHPHFRKMAPEGVLMEVQRTQALLEDLTGQAVRFLRPPYGRYTPEVRRWCAARGVQLTMWDVMPGDFLPQATVGSVVEHVVRFKRPGSVIVLHEGGRARMRMPAALEYLLPVLRADGWRFGALGGLA